MLCHADSVGMFQVESRARPLVVAREDGVPVAMPVAPTMVGVTRI
jgi:hypothetical protein